MERPIGQPVPNTSKTTHKLKIIHCQCSGERVGERAGERDGGKGVGMEGDSGRRERGRGRRMLKRTWHTVGGTQ